MRRNLLVMFVVSGAVTLAFWRSGVAQQKTYTADPHQARVALVDVAYIYKSYSRFTRDEEMMKKDAKQRETDINAQQSTLKQLLELRNNFKQGTVDYEQKNREVAKVKAELDLMADSARREFSSREAALYHRTYKEIESAINAYARAKNITLVLRTSRPEPVDTDQPQEVLKQISQQVIFATPGMDITDSILQMLNRASGATGAAAKTNRGSGVQTGSQPTRSRFRQ